MAGPAGSCPVGGRCQYGCPGAECYRENTRFADTPFAAVTLEAPNGERGVLIGPADKIAELVRPEAIVVSGVEVTALTSVGQGVVDRLRDGLTTADVAACRVCGCTEDAACPGGCSWVPDPQLLGELCSACLSAVSG